MEEGLDGLDVMDMGQRKDVEDDLHRPELGGWRDQQYLHRGATDLIIADPRVNNFPREQSCGDMHAEDKVTSEKAASSNK